MRPDPEPGRLLGTGTGVRFALLSLFIAVGSTSLLPTAIVAHDSTNRPWTTLCLLAAGVDADAPDWPTRLGSATLSFFRSCTAAHGVAAPVTWMMIDTVVVLVLAAAIYLWLPAWRRRRLLPIADDGLATRLRELVTLAGLRRPPEFRIDPAGRTSDAVVFGRLGRHTVRLNAGLIVRGANDPALLRGVVLHELAHIRNRDVDITYATVALWRAFVAGAMLPFVVLVIYPTAASTPVSTLQSLLRPAILTVFAYLVRADILRIRETHADVTAVHWSPGLVAWPAAARPRFRAWQRFLDLWRIHPSWAERGRSVAEPASLFGVSALPMFLTGVTAMLVSDATQIMLLGFGFARSSARTPVVWLPPAVLTTAVVGVALWRAVAYAVGTGGRPPSGWRAGCWLGIGLAAGELLSFRVAGLGSLPAQPLVLLAFVIGAAVLTWWVAECAELWLRTCRGRSVQAVRLFGLAATFLMFSVWLSYWTTEFYLLLFGVPATLGSHAGGLPVWFVVLFGLVNKPWIFAGAATLWLFPLASWLRRPPAGIPPWMWRFGPDPRPAEQPLLSPRGATAGIILGGILCCTAVAVAMLSLHPLQPEPAGRDAGWALRYLLRLAAALTAAIVLTAVVVAVRSRRQRLVLALVSAGGGGIIGLTGLFIFASTDGCVEPLQVMASTCVWRPEAAWSVVGPQIPFVLNIAIYAAGVAALGSAGLSALVRRLAARPAGPLPQPRVSATWSVAARRTAVLAAALLVVVSAKGAKTFSWDLAAAADPVLPSPVQPPPKAATARIEVAAWWEVGGQSLVTALEQDFRRETAAAADLARTGRRAGKTSVEIDVSVFDPICADLTRDAREAKSFAPIPDTVAQVAWAAFLTAADLAGTECQQALQGTVDGNLFTTSLLEGSKAIAALDILRARLNSL
jgi:Zn-dependent protease with chaperone function